MRIGIGYDIHRLLRGRRFVLGGVRIDHHLGLVGHSDGDALHHAIMDAALGAAGLGDIGEYFPDDDPVNLGKDSAVFVQEVRELLAKKNLQVAQIDSIVIAEEPKLSPWREEIRQSLSKCWGISVDRVNVKAKTNEGFDAVGEREAVACHAVVLLEDLKKGKK